jgi:ABC-2 type transport system permease protein
MKGVYPTLVRRELWEHRGLWLAPLITAGILLVLTIFGVAMASSKFGGLQGNWMQQVPRGATSMRFGLLGLATQLFFISSLVVVFYLLDCLYAERKDRSILFWKSLPVSDLQTVLSKFALAMLILPLGTFLVASVTYPIIYAISAAGLPWYSDLTGGWSFAAWLSAEGLVLGCLVSTMLWYAPLFAWFMLSSVMSSRSPYLMASLPVVVLGICEGLLLQSSHVWRFIFNRMMPIRDVGEGLQRPALWIGLAVAAGMLYIVIRLRRYRDDT